MIIRYFFVFFIIFFALPVAAGSLENDMQRFWNDMGFNTNVTGSSAFTGQSAGYYSMGNIHARTRSENIQLATIELPSIRAGCGGIDLFAGSFSFINSGQLVASMKAIANNAVGFSFQLALETISPLIAGKISELQDLAQMVNNAGINSCEQAASLVGSVWPKQDIASKHICEAIGSKKGLFSDYAASRNGCGSEGKRSETNAQGDNEFKNIATENINIAWEALKKSPNISSGNIINDRNLAELFMTLTGTIIIKPGDNADRPSSIQQISGKINNNEIITAILDGNNINILHCDETEKCLNPTFDGATQNVSKNNAFKEKIRNLLQEIMDHIKDDTALEDRHKGLINTTSLPLYKMLNIYAAYEGSNNFLDFDTLAEVVALNILYVYIDKIIQSINSASDNLTLEAKDSVMQYKHNLSNIRTLLFHREQHNDQTLNTTMRLIDRTETIEKLLSNRLGSDLKLSFE